MSEEKEKYLTILKLEVEHLISDISGLIEYEKELHDRNEHTHFVYLENLVVLKDEIMGLNGILGQIDKLSGDLDPSNIKEQLDKTFKEFIEKRGYPLAVYELISRKMDKIDEMQELF